MTNPRELEQAPTNPWPQRARKVLIAGAVAVVEIGNAWANGPEWVYGVAAAVAAVLVYVVPNAPKYVDPRDTATAQRFRKAIH
jgi:hypothetical protein